MWCSIVKAFKRWVFTQSHVCFKVEPKWLKSIIPYSFLFNYQFSHHSFSLTPWPFPRANLQRLRSSPVVPGDHQRPGGLGQDNGAGQAAGGLDQHQGHLRHADASPGWLFRRSLDRWISARKSDPNKHTVKHGHGKNSLVIFGGHGYYNGFNSYMLVNIPEGKSWIFTTSHWILLNFINPH